MVPADMVPAWSKSSLLPLYDPAVTDAAGVKAGVDPSGVDATGVDKAVDVLLVMVCTSKTNARPGWKTDLLWVPLWAGRTT
mmetsp:Transcript_22876/g.71950  ORF Transcript_22876/g.71950 Transcript_22876/m.71950 type:complete len:81 (-) Transcript_22876:1306-1548(-)